MKTAIFLLNIGAYEPSITQLTYPLIHRYADKIGADVVMLSDRKFPEWDMDYEKLQIYQRAQELDLDWAIYIDSDAVVHPDLPDLTALLPRDTVAHHGADMAGLRWRYDDYFRRDGRHIGSCCWLMMASRWCLDLFRPLDDLTPEEALANIFPTVVEQTSGHCKAEHLVTDYVASRNIARYGLKFTTLLQLFQKHGLVDHSTNPPTPYQFFWHAYNIAPEQKLEGMRAILAKWKLL